MDAYRKLSKDIGIYGISQIILNIRPIIFLPIITKSLGTSDYGVFVTLMATIALLIPFANLGLVSSIYRFFPAEKDKKKIALGMSSITLLVLFVSIAIAAAIFFSAGFLSSTVFGSNQSSDVVAAGSLLFLAESLLAIPLNFLTMRGRILEISILNILKIFGSFGLSVMFLWQGLGLLHVVYSFILMSSIALFAALVLMLRETGMPKYPNSGLLKGYLRFGLPVAATAAASVFIGANDRYIIGLIMGASAIGIYSVSYSLGSLIVIFISVIHTPMYAPVTKAYEEGNKKDVTRYLSYSLRYFLMLAIPSSIGLSVISMPIVASLTTPEFTIGAFGITALVSAANIVFGVFSTYTIILYLVKKTRTTLALYALGALINTLLNLALIPSIGLIGGGISLLMGYLIISVIAIRLASRHAHVSIDYAFIAKCFASAVLMGLLLFYASPRGWVQIAAFVGLSAMVYFVLMFLLRAFKPHEIDLFMGFIKKRRTVLEEPIV